MTRVKRISRRIWWWLRLGIFLCAPTLFVMGFLLFLLLRYHLSGEDWLLLMVSGLLMGSTFIAWHGRPALPQRIQTDSPRLSKLGWRLLAAVGIFPAVFLGLVCLHSGTVVRNNTIGSTLYFVHGQALFTLILLSIIPGVFLLGVLTRSVQKHCRQYTLLAWQTAFALAFNPLAGGIALVIIDKQSPTWEIRQSVQGPDRQTYSFLRATPRDKRDSTTALARHTTHTFIFDRVQLVLVDRKIGTPHGVLKQGIKYGDATQQQVCKKLLKMEQNTYGTFFP